MSDDPNENIFLQKIEYTNSHNDSSSVYKEIEKIDLLLKRNGYFLHQKEINQSSENVYTVNYSLGFRIESVHIYIPTSINHLKKGDTLKLKTNNVESFLSSISNQLDQEGKSFSEVSLKNLQLKNTILLGTLHVIERNIRKIDNIIIKGYSNISDRVVTYDLNVRKNDVFNSQKLTEISDLTKSLSFIEEIKPPEVLFAKDSTILYLYLKKKSNNSFDGIVSFASNDNNSKLLFNGTVDLKLNNLFDGGENVSLFWNSIGNEKQEFSLATRIPYAFNSRISPDVRFNLYKQDSTFLNTQFNLALPYKINTKSKISFNYSNLTSNNLKETITTNNIEAFDRSFFGVGFQYQNPKTSILGQAGLNISFHALFGTRKTDARKSEQYEFNLTLSNTFVLNERNQIYFRNQTGILLSDFFLENEVYRIGGVNSMRGFNEQSIFTSQFTYMNMEYRFATSRTSYLYTISDVGFIKTIADLTESVFGLGFGYLFSIKSTQVNLGVVLGKSSNSDFDFNNAKLNVSFTSFF
ncbi:hypothetical protein RQM59_10165 [Flavobacteriaceae bacterium S356]|uniref:Haemolysin activator HlyB C-terminal domain-containing protein n=1 Tax=Asprobacillus argus TaxID=3076534 RepID=A0ABU3LG78_9FLAO|nr:hypothetical protein [Flavobacteriaceae bacterium S356]